MAKWLIGSSVLGLAAISVAAGTASPAASARDVMIHHIAAIKKDDVAAVMQDYAPDAVVIRATATFAGTAEVRKFFERLAAEHRDWKSFIVTQEVKEHGVVLQTEVKTGQVEVFVVRDGKIVFQGMQR